MNSLYVELPVLVMNLCFYIIVVYSERHLICHPYQLKFRPADIQGTAIRSNAIPRLGSLVYDEINAASNTAWTTANLI